MLPFPRTASSALVLLLPLAVPPRALGATLPPTVNDPELATRVRPLLERILGADNVKIVEPSMAGEDFAYSANQAPGFFYRLGVVAPGTASGGLHTPTFRADDSAVPA